MIALLLSAWIYTSSVVESHGTQVLAPTNRRPKLGRILRQTQQRRLQEIDNNSCTFEKLMNKTCPLWKYCTGLTFGENVEVRCGGNIDAEWYIFMEGVETCYHDLWDSEGFPRSIEPLPATGYCSNERGFLNFTGSALVYSDVSEIITAPEESKGTLHEVYSISECQLKNTMLADYYFGKTFCDDPCPYQVQVGGNQCNSQCNECTNGRMVRNCAEISPNLVEDCDDTDNAFLFLEYLEHFREINSVEEKSRSKEQSRSENKETVESVDVDSEIATSAAATITIGIVSTMIAAFCAIIY